MITKIAYNIYSWKADFLAEQSLVLQDHRIPADAEKCEYVTHGPFRMQHELLVVDGHAVSLAHDRAVVVKTLEHFVPVNERTLVVRPIESTYGNL